MSLPLSISPSIGGIHSRSPKAIGNKLVSILIGFVQGHDGARHFCSRMFRPASGGQQRLGIWLQRLGDLLHAYRCFIPRPRSSDIDQLSQHLSRGQRQFRLFHYFGLLVGWGGVA